MKKTLSNFEQKLYWWGYWEGGLVEEFGAWLKENGLSAIDRKPKEAQEACMLGFSFQHKERLFDIIIQKGF